MRNKYIKSLLGVVLSCFIFFSCSDYLDKRPTFYETDGFFSSEAGIKSGNEGVYNSLYFTINRLIGYVYLDHFTAMCLERDENTTIGAGGGIVPDNVAVSQWWSNNYNLIARANLLITGATPYLDNLGEVSKQYVAEARILRAFAYYNLIASYGDVPFLTEPATNESKEISRTSKEDVMDFILAELEDAAQYVDWKAKERGRVDRSVAYGLKARAALFAGSTDYRGKSADYFRIAAEASSKVIGQRGLATNFDDLFHKTGQAKDDVRNEILFEVMYSDQGSRKSHVMAFGLVSRNYGQTGRHPSQLLIDTYECIDGKRIDESPLYDPAKPGENRDPRFKSSFWMHGDVIDGNTTGTESGRIRFVLEAFLPTTKFYDFNREEWYEGNNADINSTAAWTSFVNNGAGYLWRKYANIQDENVGNTTFNLIVMRYPEILLSYAEAKIELGELDESVYDAIDQVRNRSGMPSISDDRKGNQDKMRQLVRRERKVELMGEGLHFFDMRRWEIGDIENDSPSYGYPLPELDASGKVIKNGYELVTPDMIPNFKKSAKHDLNDIANYDAYKDKIKVRDKNRFWNDKFYLLPVPQSEIDLNKNLTQNPGY